MVCTMGSYFHVAMGLTPRTRISSSGNNKISTSNSNLRWSAARQGSCCLRRATGSVADVTIRKVLLSTSSSSTLPFRTSPWLMLQPEDPKVNSFYSLEEKKIIPIQKHPTVFCCMCLGSSHGWLVYINRRDCALFLFNPISNRIINLPSIDTLPGARTHPPWYMIDKLIMSSSPDDDSGDDRCIAMCIYGCNERLAFCRPGHDTAWILLDEDVESVNKASVIQIAYSCQDQLLYSFNALEMLECWDLRDPSSPKLEFKQELFKEEEEEHRFTPFLGVDCPIELWFKYRCYMEYYFIADPWSDDLLMVRRFVIPGFPEKFGFPRETHFFDVHKVDLSNGKMKYQDSLNDRVLFVGINQPFLLRASDFPHLRQNSIYFTDIKGERKIHENTFGIQDIGIFNYENKVFESCCYPYDVSHDVRNIRRMVPLPVWLTPNPGPR